MDNQTTSSAETSSPSTPKPIAQEIVTEEYARGLLARQAEMLLERITDMAKHEENQIAQHKLQELASECRWCIDYYGVP